MQAAATQQLASPAAAAYCPKPWRTVHECLKRIGTQLHCLQKHGHLCAVCLPVQAACTPARVKQHHNSCYSTCTAIYIQCNVLGKRRTLHNGEGEHSHPNGALGAICQVQAACVPHQPPAVGVTVKASSPGPTRSFFHVHRWGFLQQRSHSLTAR